MSSNTARSSRSHRLVGPVPGRPDGRAVDRHPRLVDLQRMQAAMDALPDMVLFVDPAAMRLLDANQTALESLGYSLDELLSEGLDQIVPRSFRDTLAAELQAATGQESPRETIPGVLKGCSNRRMTVEWCFRALPSDGEPLVMAIARVATEQTPAGRSQRDALTGLPDRRAFQEPLTAALARVRQRPDDRFAVLFVDLDHFKTVNDSLGHLVGDQLLCEVGRRMVECVRPGDVAARRGGDEFTVLVDHLHDGTDACLVAERILKRIRAPMVLDRHELAVTASIGIAVNSTEHERPEDLLRDADRAMYRAKALGRARYVVFDPETCRAPAQESFPPCQPR